MLYQNILDEIVDKSKQIFKENLTGIYLHGSMAMGCFNPDKSDIDLIIVIRNSITDNQKLQFMNHVVELDKAAPSKGIELSIVKEKYCREFLYPTPFELHFSKAHLQWFMDDPTDYILKMNGTDKDLAAHFKIIKKYGIVLYGEEISDVFADVPRKDYIDSIWSDIEGAKEEIEEEPIYVILNLCRVAAFLKNDLIISKKQGGEWALQNLPAQYNTLISNAVQSYMLGEEMDLDNMEAQKFADDMLQMIRDKIPEVWAYEMYYDEQVQESSEICCVPFQESYFEEYKCIYNECFYEMRKALDIEPYNWYSQYSQMADKAANIFVLCDNSQIIGSVACYGNEIDDLFVKKSCQSRGYGKQLLLWAMNHIRKYSDEEITLHVAEWNKGALRLYEDVGFLVRKREKIR